MRRTLATCFALAMFFGSLIVVSPLQAAENPTRYFAPVQQGFQPNAPKVAAYAQGRVKVKITAAAMERSQIPGNLEYNQPIPNGATGLFAVDQIFQMMGATAVKRAYIEPANQSMTHKLGIDRWFVIDHNPLTDSGEFAERLKRLAQVETATVDYIAYPMVVPSDPLHSMHWGHNNTAQMLSFNWSAGNHESGSPVGTVGFDSNAHTAWDGSQGYGSSSVVIAILDSGVEVGHPDLTQVAGWDYGDNDSNPDDNSSQRGHGTACAGVAAARANSIGPAGMAPGCSIMPLKVANSAGQMFFSSIENAIIHAADNGADIISMSLGAAITSDPATDAALSYAAGQGLVILAATGNENSSTISYPAINANVIAVGAASPCGERKRSSSSSSEVNPGVNTDPNGYTCDGERWWGSNYGSNSQGAGSAVDVIAPTILPTTDILGSDGYASGDYSNWFNGTSCSTPYAAGVCALIMSKNPSWTPTQVRDQLRNTAEDVTSVESGSGWDRYTGYGMVDAAAAVGGGGPADDVTVTNPNGGETLTAGNVETITWTSVGSFTTVDIDYSTNGGSSWTAIVSGTSNDGSYNWTVPSVATTQGRVRVSGGVATDQSNSNFTIDVPPSGSYATLPYSTGFESGSLDQYWSTFSSSNGRVRIISSNQPHSGSYQLAMDDPTNGGFVTNESWLQLDLSGESNVTLDFWWKEFGDETHSQDGVYFSDNGGASFSKVQDLNGQSYSNNTWQFFSLDLDALASANGLSLSSTFVVKFQQYDNYPIATDGHAIDDISVTGTAPPADAVTVTNPNGGETLTSGNVEAITWTSVGSFTTVNIDYSTNGGSSWTSIVSGTSNDGTYNWTVPSAPTSQGRVRVSGGTATDQSNSNFTIQDPPTGNYATLPYTTGFESGSLDQYWTSASSSNGRVRIISTNQPHSGSYQLAMDDPTNGGFVTNEAWLRLDLSGETGVDLEFWWKEFGDETHAQDGVYFSDNDGASFVKVQDLNGQSYTNNTWQNFTLDLDALASANGLSLSSTFVVKFQQYDNYPIATDGHAIDDISVTSSGGGGGAISAESEPNDNSGSADGPVGATTAVSGNISTTSDDDWYYFDVSSSGNINISVSIGSSADLDWFLYNSALTEVDRGYTTGNPEAGSYNASTGRYYLLVNGYQGATSSYTLTVTGGLANSIAIPLSQKLDLKPMVTALLQNAPNPIRGAKTAIQFTLADPGEVSLQVFDVNGRLVNTLQRGFLEAGLHSVPWQGVDESGKRVTAGVYFYRLVAPNYTETRKMLFLK
ncbi:MAG: S8 family serine peptidase [Candidatus Eisenbacteria bacterium]|uniref:S8 family serine peptidase n=1 Tax=Eiseniibacteriota bacterium TaxID=2212470 RepID=A0A7Y2EGB6_UNCEI|nr:S8 family serine peptidase [Candidatus Eisenbacteria bacterium]